MSTKYAPWMIKAVEKQFCELCRVCNGVLGMRLIVGLGKEFAYLKESILKAFKSLLGSIVKELPVPGWRVSFSED